MKPLLSLLKPPVDPVTGAPLPLDPAFEFKRKLVFAGLGASACLVLGLIYTWFIYGSSHVSTDNAYIEADFYPVHSRTLGFVLDIPVSENERVTKGQVIAVLDDTDVKVELSFKEAKYKKASADLGRAKTLVRSHAISAADYENAEANAIATKADLDGTLLKLRYTRILAPVDGTIGKRTAQAGQFVQPGQSLMMVVGSGEFWVKANYKETQLEGIRPGQPVVVEVDAYPGKVLKGKVQSIFPSSGARMSLLPPENASGNFTKIVQRIPVRISLEVPAGMELRAGMSARATVIRD